MWMALPEAAQMKHGRSNVIQCFISWPPLATESAYPVDPVAVTTVDIRTCVSRFQSLTKDHGFPRKLSDPWFLVGTADVLSLKD